MSRLKSIDALRGLALAVILVDHMPLSVLGTATPRNFALFDATELFVFMSGLAVAMVWGRAAARGRQAETAGRLVKRSGKIWTAYVATALALSALGALMTHAGAPYEAIWAGYGEALAASPVSYAAKVAFAQVQPNIVDVLVMYVVLMLASPAIAEGARVRPAATVAASGFVWWFGPQLGALLPGEVATGPLFNPFSWQAVFCLGALAWFHGEAVVARVGKFVPAVTAVAVAVMLAGLVVLKPWWFGTSHEALGIVPEQFNKWTVHPVRIASFLAAAWLFRSLAPGADSAVWSTLPARALATVGRNGLTCFCAGALLSLCYDSWGRWFGHVPGHLLADVAALASLVIVAVVAETGVPALKRTVRSIAVR
jgi:hypothetical protein